MPWCSPKIMCAVIRLVPIGTVCVVRYRAVHGCVSHGSDRYTAPLVLTIRQTEAGTEAETHGGRVCLVYVAAVMGLCTASLCLDKSLSG